MRLPRGLSEVRLNGIERLAMRWSVEKGSLNITLPSQYVRDGCLAALDRFSVRDRVTASAIRRWSPP